MSREVRNLISHTHAIPDRANEFGLNSGDNTDSRRAMPRGVLLERRPFIV